MENILLLLKNRFIKAIKSTEGVGVIEIILILLVIVGLIVVFRTQINEIISTVFGRIHEQISYF
ncbi:MAG: hypothetical protein E7266_08545 [Lachnospiraceae bacterium]|nr:hypothetical protein [Lachnospiraceae bacterium]